MILQTKPIVRRIKRIDIRTPEVQRLNPERVGNPKRPVFVEGYGILPEYTVARAMLKVDSGKLRECLVRHLPCKGRMVRYADEMTPAPREPAQAEEMK